MIQGFGVSHHVNKSLPTSGNTIYKFSTGLRFWNKYKFETLTGFTCSAVDINYFAACFLTVTGRRGNAYAYSSRIYDDISTSASAYVRGRDYASNFDSSRTSLRYQFLFRSSLFPKIRTKSSATSTPRRTRFFHRAPTLATTVLLRRAPASASSHR